MQLRCYLDLGSEQLSLLLKQNEKVSDLRLYDVRLAPGVAADISHVNTPSKVRDTCELNATMQHE